MSDDDNKSGGSSDTDVARGVAGSERERRRQRRVAARETNLAGELPAAASVGPAPLDEDVAALEDEMARLTARLRAARAGAALAHAATGSSSTGAAGGGRSPGSQRGAVGVDVAALAVAAGSGSGEGAGVSAASGGAPGGAGAALTVPLMQLPRAREPSTFDGRVVDRTCSSGCAMCARSRTCAFRPTRRSGRWWRGQAAT